MRKARWMLVAAIGFDMKVLYHDAQRADAEAERHGNATFVGMDELLAHSDAVSLHCPALPGDRPLLDAAALAQMKAGAVLINTARATLVERSALIAALDAGRLAGAAFDVFDPEPPARDDPLLAHPRVLNTPHVASWTWEGFFGRRQQAADNLAKVVRGEPGAAIVNPIR